MEISIHLLLPKAILFGYFFEVGDDENPPYLELNLGIIGIGFYKH